MALRNMLTGGGGGYNPNPLAPSAGSDVFGSRPVIPDLDEAMRQALLANLGNFGDLASLGRRTTEANQQQLLNQLMATDPLFQERAALQGADIMAQLEGRLPDAAQRYLQQVASERNVGMGVGGSPFGQQAEYGLMHDAVLGQIQQGIQNANAFRQNLASTSTVPGYDVSKSFVSPEDQAQRNLLESYAAAAPDPAARGRYEEALAREFFNRAQQGARPQPVSVPGTTGTGAASGGGVTTQQAPLTATVPFPTQRPPSVDPRIARQVAQDRANAYRSAHALGVPMPLPTNFSTSYQNALPQTYQSAFPIMSGVSGGQYAGPAFQPGSTFDFGGFRSPDSGGYSAPAPPSTSPFIDVGAGSLNLSGGGAPNPNQFNFDFGEIDYGGGDYSGQQLFGPPAAASADDWMNWLISESDEQGYYV